MRIATFGLTLAMAACAAPEVTDTSVPDVPASIQAAEPWDFETAAPTLRLASCPEGTAFERAQPITIIANEIDKGPDDAQAQQLKGVTFAGAWHLTADDPGFGGLSGLETLGSGSLLAVSDAGAWVWIGIDPETGAPDGIGSIGYMKGADGNMLSGKREGDAEGLVFKDGLALVSFERDHRIEAFDLEGCGVGALAALVVSLPDKLDGKNIGDNRGAEALALGPDGLTIGYEERVRGKAVSGVINSAGEFILTNRMDETSGFALVGMDKEGEQTVSLFRFYRPVIGNKSIVVFSGPDLNGRLEIAPPLPVDNFEGIAIGRSPAGKPRFWLISDDNFNPDGQRTLLFALDVE